MLLQNLALFVSEGVSAGSAFREQEEEPDNESIEDEIVGEYRRNVAVPDGLVIEVKLKTVHLQEVAEICRDDLDEGEVGGSLEAEDIGVEQDRQEDSIEDHEDSVDHRLGLQGSRLRTRLGAVDCLVDDQPEKHIRYCCHQNNGDLDDLLEINRSGVLATEGLNRGVSEGGEDVRVAVTFYFSLVCRELGLG